MYAILLCSTVGFTSPSDEPPAKNSGHASSDFLLGSDQYTLLAHRSRIRANYRDYCRGVALSVPHNRYFSDFHAQLIGKRPSEVAFLLGECQGGLSPYTLIEPGEIAWYWKSGMTVFYVGGRVHDAWDSDSVGTLLESSPSDRSVPADQSRRE